MATDKKQIKVIEKEDLEKVLKAIDKISNKIEQVEGVLSGQKEKK